MAHTVNSHPAQILLSIVKTIYPVILSALSHAVLAPKLLIASNYKQSKISPLHPYIAKPASSLPIDQAVVSYRHFPCCKEFV